MYAYVYTGWCPPVISWFLNPINYSYIMLYLRIVKHRIQPLMRQLTYLGGPIHDLYRHGRPKQRGVHGLGHTHVDSYLEKTHRKGAEIERNDW